MRETDRRAAEKRGRMAERLAALALVSKGYGVLAMRARTPAGEIDLIARRGDVVAFVEVKARGRVADALEAVRPAAWARIHRAAELWMARRADLAGLGWRYDVMAVRPWRWPVHARDAWRP